jgi:uncharacterized protein YceH (UPF0502 family)
MQHYDSLPHLKDEEIRVLGCLIEKSKTTPEYYPLTLHSLTTACNQKSSRKPVTNYSEQTVQAAVNSLKGLSLVSTAIGGTSRTVKYKHNFTTVYPLSEGELAILCLLFLRGSQTPGELNTNSGKLHEFVSIESVHNALQKLSGGDHPFVKELAKKSGQKEARYMHLLTEKEEENDEIAVINEHENACKKDMLEQRLEQVELELTEVKQVLNDLIKELKG